MIPSLRTASFVPWTLAALLSLRESTPLLASGIADVGAVRAAAFRMIRGQTFVAATVDGRRDADFAIAIEGTPCTIRRELAVQIWPADDSLSTREATLTVGEVVLRRISCAIGTTNALSLTRLGWDVAYDYAARELLLRPVHRASDEIRHPLRVK